LIENIVVGSGASAIGVCLGLERMQEEYKVIYDKENFVTRKEIQGIKDSILFRSGLNGLSELWHGVFSLEDFSSSMQDEEIISKLYGKSAYEKIKSKLGKKYFFIPWKQICFSKYVSVSENSIRDSVEHIKIDSSVLVKLKSGRQIKTKRLWLCSGAFNTPKILEASKLATRNKYISDHLCGYVGSVESSEFKNEINYLNPSYIKSYIKSKDLECTYQLRPAMFDFKNLSTAINFRTVYSNQSHSVISKVLKSLSPGLYLEAAHNKFGVPKNSEKMNVFVQIEAKNIYETTSLQTNERALKMISEKLQKDFLETFRIKAYEDLQLFSGIHFFNSIDNNSNELDCLKKDKIINICDASNKNRIGGTHPTFPIIRDNYNLVIQTFSNA
jgi:hypothetical protein